MSCQFDWLAAGSKVKIRQIAVEDEAEVVDLLAEGFPTRSRIYWQRAFQKLVHQVVPTDHAQIGFLMQEATEIVGILLIIWTPPEVLGSGQMRANLSSWYVKPPFRSFAAMLLAKASRHAGVTYLNVSAAANTIQICEALGFKKYTEGQSVSVPLLSHDQTRNRVFRFGTTNDVLPPVVRQLMANHVEMGCLALVGEIHGSQVPFLFVKRKIRGWIPAWQLIYCRHLADFEACSRGIGRVILGHGSLFVICDAERAFNDMPSVYYPGKTPKYYKGPDVPSACDLSFTEIPLFGI
jgi:hypothetical protein